MKSRLLRSMIAGILAVAVLTGQVAPSGAAAVDVLPDGEQSAVSGQMIPAESEPTESEPTESEPTESEPTESEPTESEPAESEPAESEPAESEPAESEPAESEPAESEPAESEPAESEPAESEPAESEPAESEPAESEPAESEPAESEPAESEPAESEPAESIPEEPEPEESDPEMELSLTEELEVSGPGLYFGLFHAHTGDSDGAGTPAEAFEHAAVVENLDFFAVTDHSHALEPQGPVELGEDAAEKSPMWAAGKAAAQVVTSATFVGIYGFEMSWPGQYKIGHISTFNTPGFQFWNQDAYRHYDHGLQNYYETLASVPASLSQFNHPGTQYGAFLEFDYSEGADAGMVLLEVGSGGADAYDFYVQALDKGWHLAPSNNQANHDRDWGSASSARTVVYARELTEAGIYDALRQYRAYATEDADLEILYSMEDHWMGARLEQGRLGETADITVTLSDPTDPAVGLVEVISNGGEVIARETLASGAGTLSFSLQPEMGYYFLRITQPDGDTAVTAPIWIEGEAELGIRSLTCQTVVPVQKEDVSLILELVNEGKTDFSVESLEIFADEDCVAVCDVTGLEAGSTQSLSVTVNCDCVGLTRIMARLTGTLEGSTRVFEVELELNFRQSRQVTSILVDGSHGNAEADRLTILAQMAREESIDLIVLQEEASAEELKEGRFFLIPGPATPFSEGFLEAVSEYAGYGGSLVICGQGDLMDTEGPGAAELNRLLSALGSTMAVKDDLAVDRVNNGGNSSLLFLENINRDLSWCTQVSENQTFRVHRGATVDPGSGSWMVKGFSTTLSSDADGDGLGGDSGDTVMMACEALPGGGTLFLCGSLFCSDENMDEPENIWDEPYANRTIAQTLLGIGGEAVPLSTIREARAGEENDLFRIRGYVTAGTSNPYNTFPETIYLQDDTGGIAVTPFSGSQVQQGAPVEVIGFAQRQNGNRILKVSSWKVLDAAYYQYEPLEGDWQWLLDQEWNGGTLVQVEGECQEIYCREDDTMAGCLLQEEGGRQVKILIEDGIRNGSDGENELHKSIRKGRTVRAAGLLHLDEYGKTVIRVRNCEEVVYVPPRIFPGINPLTADPRLPWASASMAASLAGLLLIGRRKKQ